MVNNLNSVIVEGTIIKCDKVDKAAFFRMKNVRHFKDFNHEIHEETFFFDVEVYGKLADACNDILDEGCAVRVVGRLKSLNYENFKVVIYAEHIEAKPMTVEENA